MEEKRSCKNCRYGATNPDGACHHPESPKGEISDNGGCQDHEFTNLNPYEVLNDMWVE